MGNLVFLGPMSGNRQVKAVPAIQELVLEPQGVRIVHPNPGEEPLLADGSPKEPRDIIETYALISRMPSLYNQGEILYIGGNQIASVVGGVKAFTDPDFAKSLLAKLKARGGALPTSYQVVIKVRSMADLPIDFKYVLHRELKSTGQ